jgi:hypothetical protein
MCASRHSLIENLESAVMPLTCMYAGVEGKDGDGSACGKGSGSLVALSVFIHLDVFVFPLLLPFLLSL